jgi:hypothetical protein
MKAALSVLAALAVALLLVSGAGAADETKTLKGTLLCGKCTLKVCDECTNVLQVKEGDKTVDYFIKDETK